MWSVIRLKRRIKCFIIFLTVFAAIISVIFIFLFERHAMPAAEEMMQQYAVTEINNAINDAVESIVQKRGISAEDMYTLHFDTNGKVNYLEVNSIMINSVCSDAARILSGELNAAKKHTVRVPLWIMTGFDIFAQSGPELPLYLSPVGSAEVDYETSVESAGIGQVNFKVWLVVKTDMTIVSPLMDKRISIMRKLMLVNTVFSGEVPEAFYGGKQ